MALETASYIANLVATNPDGADQRNTADDHLRLIKATLKRTFPLLDGAVSLTATQFMRMNDVSRSVQFQLNGLRDGTATANNALYANSASFASFAASASDAQLLGGITADRYARVDSNFTFSVDIRIRQSSPQIFFEEIGASLSSTNAVIGWDARVFSIRFYDSDYSANHAWFVGTRTPDGSNQCERIALGATEISLSASAVRITGGSQLYVGGRNVFNAQLFDEGTLRDAVVSFDNVQQHAASLSVFRALTAISASSAATVTNFLPNTSATANTVVIRDSNRDIFARFFHSNQPDDNSISANQVMVTDGTSGYIWKVSTANLGTVLSAQNITGRTGTRKNLVSGSGPPTISAGSQNGEMWFYY